MRVEYHTRGINSDNDQNVTLLRFPDVRECGPFQNDLLILEEHASSRRFDIKVSRGITRKLRVATTRRVYLNKAIGFLR